MSFVLGVDGGNTKTLALVARDNGVILGTGRAGCSDIYGAESPAAAINEIGEAVESALAEAGFPFFCDINGTPFTDSEFLS